MSTFPSFLYFIIYTSPKKIIKHTKFRTMFPVKSRQQNKHCKLFVTFIGIMTLLSMIIGINHYQHTNQNIQFGGKSRHLLATAIEFVDQMINANANINFIHIKRSGMIYGYVGVRNGPGYKQVGDKVIQESSDDWTADDYNQYKGLIEHLEAKGWKEFQSTGVGSDHTAGRGEDKQVITLIKE